MIVPGEKKRSTRQSCFPQKVPDKFEGTINLGKDRVIHDINVCCHVASYPVCCSKDIEIKKERNL